MAHAAFHDQGDDISTGMTVAWAWAAAPNHVGPCPKSMDRLARRRSTPDLFLKIEFIARVLKSLLPFN